MTDNAQSTTQDSQSVNDEWWWDVKTVAQFLEDCGFEWTYDGQRNLTFNLPHTPRGDSLHEYLGEIGEPLE